jgi:hypothetical protein
MSTICDGKSWETRISSSPSAIQRRWDSSTDPLLQSPRCRNGYRLTFQLRLPEGGSVASDQDELGLARAQRLEGRSVSEDDCNFNVSILSSDSEHIS